MKRNPIPVGRFVKVQAIRKNKNGTIDVVMAGAKKKNPRKKKAKKSVVRKKRTTRKRKVTNSRKRK